MADPIGVVLPEAKKLQALADVLAAVDNVPNRIGVNEFLKFQILYQKPDPENPVDGNEITKLSADFMDVIDPYKPIEIMNGSEVLVTLPAIYTPLEPIAQQHAALVDANYAMGDSDIPKYRDEALFNMANKLLESQLSDENIKRIQAGRIKYRELDTKFRQQKSGEVVAATDDEEADVQFDEWE